MKLPFEPRDVENRLDLTQQGFPPAALAVGVWLHYREDRCYEYAALLSYYGFFSLFPLLLVLVTVLGVVLRDNSGLRQAILDSVFTQIPVLGEMIKDQIGTGLDDSGFALVVAIGFTLWAGIGVIRVTQDAFNTVWGVSIMRRPSFFPKLFRALLALAVVGGAFLVATVVSGWLTFANLSGLAKVGGVLVAIGVSSLALLLVFKVLTNRDIPWGSLWVGATVGGIGFWLLQLVGGLYIGGVIAGASRIYGVFASVIGLLVWLALVSRVVLLAAEVNVVVQKRFWPRSFNGRNLTEADERSFAEVGAREIRRA